MGLGPKGTTDMQLKKVNGGYLIYHLDERGLTPSSVGFLMAIDTAIQNCSETRLQRDISLVYNNVEVVIKQYGTTRRQHGS